MLSRESLEEMKKRPAEWTQIVDPSYQHIAYSWKNIPELSFFLLQLDESEMGHA